MTWAAYANEHWFTAFCVFVTLASGVSAVLSGIGRRIGGTCDCEPCECPAGCHDEDSEGE